MSLVAAALLVFIRISHGGAGEFRGQAHDFNDVSLS
jgi:hypothetical protein